MTETETDGEGAPFFFATGRPPTATTIDDDIYLTVVAALPGAPGGNAAIDIVLPVDYAAELLEQLDAAVRTARGGRGANPRPPPRSRR